MWTGEYGKSLEAARKGLTRAGSFVSRRSSRNWGPVSRFAEGGRGGKNSQRDILRYVFRGAMRAMDSLAAAVLREAVCREKKLVDREVVTRPCRGARSLRRVALAPTQERFALCWRPHARGAALSPRDDHHAGLRRAFAWRAVRLIFEPFFTTTEGVGGTGLGLSIVRDIVESHRGRVWAERRAGTGAAFHVELPVVTGD